MHRKLRSLKRIFGKTRDSSLKTNAFFLLLLIAIVGIFEFLPAVDQAREQFLTNFDKAHRCEDVLKSRPWYGRINPWIWFWLLATPVIVFSTQPLASVWVRAGRVLFAIALAHIVVNLGAHLAMDIRNAPFRSIDMSGFGDIDNFKRRCIDIADGAKLSGALFFGWVYGVFYTGWWLAVWHQYHKRITKLIDGRYRTDWISGIVVFASVFIPLCFLIWAVWSGAT